VTKAQSHHQDSQKDFEAKFQAGLGLPVGDTRSEDIKKLQEAIGKQQEKTKRLLNENKTHLH
jgi:hypothetical protein